MKRYLLDSNALNEFFRRPSALFERAISVRKNGAMVGTGLPVLAEFLGGIEHSATRDRNMGLINRNLRRIRLWHFDLDAAREYGRLYATMRQSGKAIQAIDLMAAAIAMTLPNCTVVTSDSDFNFVPGLKVEDWTEPRI